MTQQAEPGAIPDGDGAERPRGRTGRVVHPDGFGAAFCASMAGLCAELALSGTVAVLVLLAREHDGLPSGVVLVAVLLLAAVLLGVLFSGFATAVAVMPALALARRLARRAGRDERWPWTVAAVPVVSAGAVAAFGGVAALGSMRLAHPLAYLVWWGALSAALLPAALIARAAGRAVRAGRPPRLVRRVSGYGALAWLAVGALGAGAYGSGLVKVYEPPRLGSADLAGTWADDHGGKVRLTSDGLAFAKGLDHYTWDGTGKPRSKDCDGSGTWSPVEDNGTVQGVSLRIAPCELVVNWSVAGTQKKPRIFHEIGKPGQGKRYVLTKVVKGAGHHRGDTSGTSDK
ncbi:hypothetical protein ACFP1Z_16440 [Streptomyces gamaensis]|uniref:Uncharacterized protein n=1 Tax=Streptomyces gamaensis TaxID=1763542 RepID=A0ABW0Z1U5_9ACTN